MTALPRVVSPKCVEVCVGDPGLSRQFAQRELIQWMSYSIETSELLLLSEW